MECYDSKLGYKGTLDRTVTGQPCQNWKSRYTRKHSKFNLDKFLELEDHQFCRNPGNMKPQPWCYIKSKRKLEVCPVLPCSDDKSLQTNCSSGSQTESEKMDYQQINRV